MLLCNGAGELFLKITCVAAAGRFVAIYQLCGNQQQHHQ